MLWKLSLRPAAVLAAAVALLFLAPAGVTGASSIAAGWNEGAIAWRTAEEGLAEAKRTGRPVLMLVHTTWCPYCRAYQQVFKDPRVVELAKRLVMVIVDRDKEQAVSDRFAPDGTYVPRTMFLDPTGQLDTTLANGRWRYRYVLDTTKPDELIGLMQRAAARAP